jgi:benzoylformate decarboxylase
MQQPRPEELTVRASVHALMRELGMTVVFGNPGSTELRFLAEWPSDFRYVMALHEGASVAMADAYAQLTRNAAFVNLHSAGGLGNAMGTLFTAYRNAAPLVVVAGQQTRAMLPSEPFLFASDAPSFPKPYVKWSVEPARAEDVPGAVARAYRVAMERPYGPTFVSIPEDDWQRAGEPVEIRRVESDVVASTDVLAGLAAALDAAESPALVAGAGVDRDGASAAAVRLAERTGARVWASALTGRCGFPEDHPLFAGALPRDRRGVTEQLRGRDLVVVLGAPVFNYHVHREGPFLPAGTTLFGLTDDPSLASYAVAGTSIITSLRPALELLLGLLRRARPSAWPARAVERVPATEPMSVAYLLQTVRETLPADAIIFEEAPSIHSTLHDAGLLQPGRYFSAASGSLGYALPAAIGGALAAPERPILALIGDGSSLYAIQALWTAAQHALPIVFVIVNNGGYGAMKAFGRLMTSGGAPSFDIPGIDFVAAAAGFGVRALRVTRSEGLASALAEAYAAHAPMLLDVPIDPSIQALR